MSKLFTRPCSLVGVAILALVGEQLVETGALKLNSKRTVNVGVKRLSSYREHEGRLLSIRSRGSDTQSASSDPSSGPGSESGKRESETDYSNESNPSYASLLPLRELGLEEPQFQHQQLASEGASTSATGDDQPIPNAAASKDLAAHLWGALVDPNSITLADLANIILRVSSSPSVVSNDQLAPLLAKVIIGYNLDLATNRPFIDDASRLERDHPLYQEHVPGRLTRQKRFYGDEVLFRMMGGENTAGKILSNIDKLHNQFVF